MLISVSSAYYATRLWSINWLFGLNLWQCYTTLCCTMHLPLFLFVSLFLLGCFCFIFGVWGIFFEIKSFKTLIQILYVGKAYMSSFWEYVQPNSTKGAFKIKTKKDVYSRVIALNIHFVIALNKKNVESDL